MKNIILLIGFLFCATIINAQRGYLQTIAQDTVNGNETIYFYTTELIKGGTVSLQALCTQVGGTSDGTIVIEASEDRISWETLTTTAGLFHGFPNDTLTIVNGAVGLWVVENNPFGYLRYKVAGTASDSTLITPKYRPKN